MAFFRRFSAKPPQLAPLLKPPTPDELKRGKPFPANVGLWTEESFQALQRFLRDLFMVQEASLPAGEYKGIPARVEAGAAGLPGNPELGWANGTHKHPIYTAAAANLTPISTNTEGASAALARADHTHDMSQVMGDVMSKVSLRF